MVNPGGQIARSSSVQNRSAAQIQALVRSFLVRRRLLKELRPAFDSYFSAYDQSNESVHLPNGIQIARGVFLLFILSESQPTIVVDVVMIIKRSLLLMNYEKDDKAFSLLCRYLTISGGAKDLQKNFNILAMSPSTILSWLWILKRVLWLCLLKLSNMGINVANRFRLNLYLHTLLFFTSSGGWATLVSKEGREMKSSMEQLCEILVNHLFDKGLYRKLWLFFKGGLCRSSILIKADSLCAAFSLALRPLSVNHLSDDVVKPFVLHVLSTPAITWHLKHMARDFKMTFLNGRLILRCVQFCNSPDGLQSLSTIPHGFEVCLFGNLVYLGFLEETILKSYAKSFVECLQVVISYCKSLALSSKSSVTHWHPLLGWYSKRLDSNLQEALPAVQRQIHLLWDGRMIRALLSPVLCQQFKSQPISVSERDTASSLTGIKDRLSLNFFNVVLKQSTGCSNRVKRVQEIPQDSTFALTFYQKLLSTLLPLKYDLLAGLCYQESLLPNIWKYLFPWDTSTSVNYYVTLAQEENSPSNPVIQSVHFFFELAAYLLTVADDFELFSMNKLFNVAQMIEIASFCNLFAFRSIWEQKSYANPGSESGDFFLIVCNFLSLIYNRHCRCPFAPDGFWLIKELKSAQFLAEIDKGSKRSQLLVERIPHVIPYKERINLFRKHICSEKDSLSLSVRHGHMQPTFITVHRSRLIEDGFRQLVQLSGNTLRGVIRVKFINAQGLEEAGIDQDGVFKEFLEEVVKDVFDPAFNLFKLTSDGHLYPSPSSTLHENCLSLFEFAGKMLGKAVFEGIVVDVYLARFVLNHLIGRVATKYYSSLDELASLDADLHRHLSFIKHYKGDVSELGLTFSCDEEVLGELVTHDLRPGGRTIYVTNESKICYVHLMAHYRMHVQIKDQIAAFVRGFHDVVNNDHLKQFSADEFQQLISGSNGDIDIQDLRKHTQYFGGFHSSHRVIRWLWNILTDDFTPAERRLFLKFVTSCSKPPLLGFEYLDPPFSIRCVDVADDQDEGDTLGSVIRGFLAIRKHDPVGRLPTSSTCFNLLKLPNYHKKSTLRDKLRYAINCSTGFELS